MTYSSLLLIEETDAIQGGAATRSMALMGGGLPLMGSEWGGKNQNKTTWYPGNGEEATQQVLGPRELPSHWRGEWRITMLPKTPCRYISDDGSVVLITSPFSLWNLLETMFRSGIPLRVTWAQQSTTGDDTQEGKVVREGLADTWHFKPIRIQDIDWDIEFVWRGRGGVRPRVSTTRSNLVTTNGPAFQDAVKALVNNNLAIANLRQNPAKLTLGQIEAIADTPTKIADAAARSVQQIESQVGQVVNIAATLANQPVQIQARAVDLAQNTVAQLNNFYDELSRTPVEQLTTRQKLSSLLQAHLRFGQASDDALASSDAGRTFTEQLRAVVQATSLTGAISPTRTSNPSSILQVYVCKQGDTPESVSQRYYGTTDHAVDVLRANRMAWHTSSFPMGKVIVIPALQTTQATIGA